MARGVARGGFQGFRNPPLVPRNPPLLFITVILSQQEFYAYSKYIEHHCGIYLPFTCIFRDMSRVGVPV